MICADTVFYNGKIYTMNEPGETVEALVVRDGKILFAGTSEEALAYPAGRKEDLGGRVGLPGFSDTHIHVLLDCMYKSYVDLSGAKSVAEIVSLMREGDDGSDGWLIGVGIFSENLAENRFPERYEL
ncbi:MAG: amidohydrolase family protein, partial [Clostridiales Family XIII bacterium]|nr:amidohydrolase family protein [Clostridiales Family XIII bacterium]